MSYRIQKPKRLEQINCKKKVFHNNNKKNMDNLHFIPNNIFTNFFKELTNYKNDYQQFFFFFFFEKRLSIVFQLYT